MDLKNILNDIKVDEHQKFNYCLALPKKAWSIASSVSSTETLSPMNISKIEGKPHQQTRIPWTPFEDHLLKRGYNQGLSWAMISSKYLPHRSRGCCWGRFKTLRAKAAQKKNWAINESLTLLTSTKKHDSFFEQTWKSLPQDLAIYNWKKHKNRSSHIGFSCSSQIIIP